MRKALWLAPRLAAILLGAVISRQAYANSVPAGSFQASVGNPLSINGPSTVTFNTTSVSLSYCNGALGCSSGTASDSYSSGNGLASGSGSTTGTQPPPLASGGQVSFYFEVTGPAGESVPVIVSGSGSATASGIMAGASVVFEWVQDPSAYAEACAATADYGSCGTVPNAFSKGYEFNIPEGWMNEVTFSASGNNVNPSTGVYGAGSWSASIDPMVEIDNSSGLYGAYTLEFSPNPPSSVPEPRTANLMIVGLCVLAMAGAFGREKLGA